MPPRGVKPGTKRARHYDRIKDSEKSQGASEGRAEKIAARTVNKAQLQRAVDGRNPSEAVAGSRAAGRFRR